ncbi:hypothetical protein QQG55_45635 [Brugia pahangi]
MNLSTTISDDVTPTTAREEAVIVDPDVASTSTQLMPKKGILKRSSSQNNFPHKDTTVQQSVNGHFFELKQSSARATDRPTTKIPKLTLTWSEKNAVTIYGDTTSDEATTETDDIQVPIIAPISTVQHLSSPTRRNIRLNEYLTKIATKIPFNMHTKEANVSSERQTAILYDDDENEDEDMMITNDNDEVAHDNNDDDEDSKINGDNQQHDNVTVIGNSHIAGKWWFGKSIKNIPHCAKWGCTHNHRDKEFTDNDGKYLTPTQQRFKEIHHLRKQLKLTLAQLEDKDLHLNELRDQLRDLESVVNSMNNIDRQHQLLLQHKESSEDYEREKQKLIDKHEIRVRQLIQEAVDARAEMMKLQIALKQQEEVKAKIEAKDAEVMTETADDILHCSEPSQILPSFPSSPQVERTVEHRAVQVSQDLPLQLQAYENEAMAWRMKAAQLEMVLKDQIFKTQQGITPELEKCRNENEHLRMYIKNMEANITNHTMIDSGFELNLNPILTTNITDCYSQYCEERRKQLMDENQRLNKKVEEDKLRLNECDEDISMLHNTIHSMEEENRKNFLIIEQMSKEIEEKNAEIEAANITAIRLQSEIAMKTKAICYLEERHQIYRNTILDNHLVIKDESTDNWKRGFSDPRFIVNVSKRVQTDLTQETLRTNEVNFVSLTDKLEVLKKEFSSKESNMLERFQEIEKALLIKSSLVNSLASQLEEADREATRSTDLHQKEREIFQEKLHELGQIAKNVPILQFEIDKLQQERSLLEYQLRNAKEEYEAGLDVALAESLKKYHKQSNYWTEKVSAINASNELLRNENIALKRSIDELKLRTQIQRADLSKRLTSSISHVTHLKKQLNRSTRDVQVDVHPRVVSKYVACRPNARHKMTDIEKGDLFDEVEERLKICQNELIITRQQVAMLQQKLCDSVQIQVNDYSMDNSNSSVNVSSTDTTKLCASMKTNGSEECNLMLKNLRGQIEEIKKQNYHLAMQLVGIETEKENLLDSQQQQKQHQQMSHHILENDIHNELDLELGHYENERQRLEEHIAILEKVEVERGKLLKLLKNKKVLEEKCNSDTFVQAILQNSFSPAHTQYNSTTFIGDYKKITTNEKIHIKRWMSVPHLFRLSAIGASTTSSEIATLRDRNCILTRNNTRLNEELINFKYITESTSNNKNNSSNKSSLLAVNENLPTFDLAADLMQVQEDLENVIIQIDKSGIMNEIKNNNCLNKSTSLSLTKRNSLTSDFTDDVNELKSALKRLHDEYDTIVEQLNRVTLNFQEACRELNLYKHELSHNAFIYSNDKRLPRSRSFVETGRATVDLNEYIRWKEKAGTMFRELNRIRKEYGACDGERRELRMQLVMLRGELGLTQCQLAEMLSKQRRKQHGSVSNASIISINDLSSSVLNKRKKIKSRLLHGKSSDKFWDAMDSSSAIFFTACTSISSSINDIMCSTSEPELAATKFEGVREYRFSNHNHCNCYLLPTYSQESRKLSPYPENCQLNSEKREEIIKLSKLQTKSLSKIEIQEKDISEKVQNVKNREKLKNQQKQIAEIKKRQIKLTKEELNKQPQKK